MKRARPLDNFMRRVSWTLIVVLALFVCSASATLAQGVCATAGNDGPGGTLSGVINTYHPGTASAGIRATSIQIGASRIGGAATPITAGDLLLVIQMQDAGINSSNNTNYGANNGTGRGTNAVNYAGRYEYVVATNSVGLGGGTVTIRGTGAGNGLLNIYTNAASSGTQGQRRFQVVRVPQYSTATLSNSLTAAAWDGSTGGILAFDVAGALSLASATVNVSGLGFRGGGGRPLAGGAVSGTNPSDTDYRFLTSTTTASTIGAHGAKGEGIAGTPRYVYDAATGSVLNTGAEGYPNGSNGRGAPGNAGGGGTDSKATTTNEENSGGGGGGNGGIGGQGGNTWNANAARGGIGGAAFTGAADRVVLGGGGGAGSRNNSVNVDSSGAAGGGIVLVRTGVVTGTGAFTANGSNALNNTLNDGGGAGGAGGSIIVTAGASLGGLTLQARGGRGGDAWRTQTTATFPGERHGPGGGGAGGFTAYTAGATPDTLGGANGTTTTLFDAYNATGGGNGVNLPIAQNAPPGIRSGAECVPALTVTKTTATPNVTNTATGTTATYTITVANAANRSAATSVSLSDALPAGFTYKATGTITLTGGATRPSTTTPTLGATNPAWSSFTIPASGQVALTFTVDIAAGVVTGTYQNPATATFLDAARTTPTGTTTANYNSASSTGEDVNVTSTPDLTIVKAHTGNFTRGQTGIYTVTVTNSGPGATSGTVTVTDTLPAGLSPNAAAGTGWTCGFAAQVFTCTRSDALATAGSYPAITFTVNVLQTAPNSLTNTASVSGGGETNTANSSDDDPTDIVSLADLSLTKTADNSAPTINQNVTFTITVTNAGPSDATGLAARDQLPAGLTFVSATPSAGAYVAATGVWTVGTINAGANATLQIVAKVTASGAITNTAEVTASAAPDPDSTPDNNNAAEDDQASAVLGVPVPPSITLQKRCTLPANCESAAQQPGTELTYTITFTNGAGTSAARPRYWRCRPTGRARPSRPSAARPKPLCSTRRSARLCAR